MEAMKTGKKGQTLSVGSFEAKTHLSSLLEKVGKGERVIITRHGAPIAQLIPVERNKNAGAGEVVRQIRQARRGVKLGGLSVRALIEEGRR